MGAASSSELDSTFFLAFFGLRVLGDFDFESFLGFSSSSDSDSDEDCFTGFFFAARAFWTGDLALTTFLGFSSELYSSSDDDSFLAFFLETIAFWRGDLALTAFLGFSSELDSSYEDDSCFFLGTGSFLAAPFSALICLEGFF